MVKVYNSGFSGVFTYHFFLQPRIGILFVMSDHANDKTCKERMVRRKLENVNAEVICAFLSTKNLL